MAYRDEHQALRARLEATEERLRIVETELEEARRLLAQHDEPAALAPSTAPPESRRVGYPPTRSAHTQYGATFAAVLGLVLGLFGVAFLLWSFPGETELGEVLTTLGIAAGVGLAPGGALLYYALRAPARARRMAAREPGRAAPLTRTRVAPARRVEVPLARDTAVQLEREGNEDDEDDVALARGAAQ